MKNLFSFFIFFLSLSTLSASEIDKAQTVSAINTTEWKSFSLSEVQLTESYFKQAMERHKEYILSLEVDRLIPHVRSRAGLQPKGRNYGGWERGGGCTYGHYMSSCAMMYAATGDKQFIDRLDYILSELKECQEKFDDGWFISSTRGREGFNSLLKGELQLNRPDETKQPWNFNQNGNSWYSIHKILTGLKDAFVYAGRTEAKEILLKLADIITGFVLPANSDLFQGMLSVEQGGMNEVFTDIYAIAGDEKYLKTAQKFNHINVIYPTANGEDVLFGRHANDQIPKFIGVARQYEFVNNLVYKKAAENFWNIVLENHTLAIGGNSCYERFGIPGEESKRLDYSSAEVCNTYNMLKLTRQLFMLTGEIKYLDYYEHALYNHILASQDPDMPGCVTYYTSLLPGLFKQYSTPYESFWCCVGTGLENHAKYAESIFFCKQGELLVNLFIPSKLNWKDTGLNISMETKFPDSDTVRIKINDKGNFSGTISFRYPEWIKTQVKCFINGNNTDFKVENGYIRTGKQINSNDEIILVFPRTLYVDYVKDEPHFGTVMYGPLVLAGELGNKNMPNDRVSQNRDLRDALPLKNIPVLVGNTKELNTWIINKSSSPLRFEVKNGEKQPPVSLIPYFQMHHQYYTVYWKMYSSEEFKLRAQSFTDEVLIDDTENEKKHNLKEQESNIYWHDFFWAKNTQYRIAENNGWFSYDLKIDKNCKIPYFLICRFWGDESPEHQFDILIDEVKVKEINLNRRLYLTYVDDLIEIPYELTKGKDKINVKFYAKEGKKAGGLYQLKITSNTDFR